MGFEPSTYSGPASYGDYGVDLSWLGPAIQAGGAIASTSITTVGAKKAQESQQQADLELAEMQKELVQLQTEGVRAQTASQGASASLEGLAAKKTFYVVGGLVLIAGMVSIALVLRSRPAEDEE
jgi:hypothetical protein